MNTTTDPKTEEPLARAVREQLDRETDPRAREWLAALLTGDAPRA
jgi:hypothetical protein